MSMLTRKRDVPREVAVQHGEDGRAETHHAESMPESRESVEQRARIIESMMKAFDESVADRKKTAIGDAIMDLDIKLHYGVDAAEDLHTLSVSAEGSFAEAVPVLVEDGPIDSCYQDPEVPEPSCARPKKTLHRSAQSA